MKVGVANEDIWDFFHEIYADLEARHQTSLFKRRVFDLPILNTRVNRYFLQRDLQTFIQANQVIFFEWASELLAVTSQLPKRCGLVTRMHRYDMYDWLDHVNWANVDKIILVSQAKQQEFGSQLPDQAHKIVVIPEAVSLEKFQPQPSPFRGNIGILCHLKPRKRVYDLVLTFYELTQKMDGLHLYIGGDKRPLYADYYEALHTLVRKLGLQEKVTFDGRITAPQDWYHKIDIFVSNSYSEGLQVSPMEAMASGCYCLSHHWDGADELLPAENLFFTGSELQEKILSYCEASETEKQREITRLRDMVNEKFNIDKTKVQIRQIIEEVGASR